MSVSRLIPIGHPVLGHVDAAIFSLTFVPDCVTHQCRCRLEDNRTRLDACCHYGADVDAGERDQILARAALIAPYLKPPFRDSSRWFEDETESDADFPSGLVARTLSVEAVEDGQTYPAVTSVAAAAQGGCVFLHHDGRGCAIHRAAAEHGFGLRGVKPMVCRLFPLTFGEGKLLLSDEYDDYSCMDFPGGSTIYHVMRHVLADVFDAALVAELDRVEKKLVRPLTTAGSAAASPSLLTRVLRTR